MAKGRKRTSAKRKEIVMVKERKTGLAKRKEHAHPWDVLQKRGERGRT
jgi:hypothetical protein